MLIIVYNIFFLLLYYYYVYCVLIIIYIYMFFFNFNVPIKYNNVKPALFFPSRSNYRGRVQESWRTDVVVVVVVVETTR